MKRTRLKPKSDRQIYISRILKHLREERKKEKGDKCEICGRWQPNLGMHHILERSRCPRLIVHSENLLLMCYLPCHNDLHHFTANNPRYKKVEARIRELRGDDYEEKLLILDKQQPKLTLTLLKFMAEAYK